MSGSAIFTPERAMEVHQKFIQLVKDNPHKVLPFCFDITDGYIEALLPSQIAVLQGQSSNGKSVLLNQWAKFTADNLPKDNPAAVVVIVDTEISAEVRVSALYRRYGISTMDLVNNRADPTALKAARREMSMSKILRISSSFMDKIDVADLFYRKIEEEIYALSEEFQINYDPAVIMIDYLQSIARDPEWNGPEHLAIGRDMSNLRGLGVKFACPTVVAAQSKQGLSHDDVYNKDLPIPDLYAVQGSSTVAQKAVLNLSVLKADKVFPLGDTIEVASDNVSFVVTTNLFFIRVTKQQGDLPSGAYYPFRLDFDTQEFIHAPDALRGPGRHAVASKGMSLPL